MNIAGLTTHTPVPGIFLADKEEWKLVYIAEAQP